MADLKKTLLSIQQIFLLIVAVAVVFFAFLNMDPVTIDLFFTSVTTSVALLTSPKGNTPSPASNNARLIRMRRTLCSLI